MQQEELARLFSANLNLSQTRQPEPQTFVQQSVQPVQQQTHEQTPATSPIVYASQHYTHSYHVPIQLPPSPAPEKTLIEASELEEIFLRNSIDPSLLFPSQVDLFQNADDDQRLRLLELWRISPPQRIPAGMDYNTSRQLYDWPPTSLAQEESMAKLRYERMQQEEAQAAEIQLHQAQMDRSMDQVRDSPAAQAMRNSLLSCTDETAEPYMMTGYEMISKREYEDKARSASAAAANCLRELTRYRQATDPVFGHNGANGGLWEKQNKSIVDMENQYGAFAHARDYDDQPAYADDQMIM